MGREYDIVVIGGGVAGLTASIYAGRYGLNVALFERMMGGNQMVNVERIEDFPGFPQGISGAELIPQIQEQALAASVVFRMEEVYDLTVDGPYKNVITHDGIYRAQALIIAAGSTLSSLGLPREAELYGNGISKCASCDGPLFQGQKVGVVGGGDSAADEAYTLTQFVSKVVLFHRRDRLRAKKVLQEQLLANPKIQVMWSTVVEEIQGEHSVTGVRVRNLSTGESSNVAVSGLFVYVGLDPNSQFTSRILKLDNAGHILVNLQMETNIPGIFAAGDIRQNSAAQLVSAAGDGATAAISAYRYLNGMS